MTEKDKEQVIKIRKQLRNPKLDPDMRADLHKQLRALKGY